MLNIKSLTLALGAIALATVGMTANAGSWPNLPAKKTAQASVKATDTIRVAKQVPVAGDFEYIGGDSDWQLRQHKFELRGGTFAHASDCRLVASLTTAPQPAPARTVPAGDQLPGA